MNVRLPDFRAKVKEIWNADRFAMRSSGEMLCACDARSAGFGAKSISQTENLVA